MIRENDTAEQGTEPDWVRRLAEDHPDRDQAITELRQIIVQGLKKSLVHRYGGQVAPEDVAQDAILKILDSLDQFEGRSRFTTWAMTIATRIGISELRRKHYRDVSLNQMIGGQESQSFDVPDQSQQEIDSKAQKQELIRLLHHLIEEKLTPRQQVAIRAVLAGFPVEVIAEKMESNRNAIYKLVHDARKQLKTGLEQAGMTAPEIHQLFA